MNIVFVSHCDFHGNSAIHLFNIANGLKTIYGINSVICVPNQPDTVKSIDEPNFTITHYDKARVGGVTFADGKGPDLIHAWTPRELVRRLTLDLTALYKVPYLVHLEDNEEVIVADEFPDHSYKDLSSLPLGVLDSLIAEHRSHPVRYKDFIKNAAGVTALMDRLLEFCPEELPGRVFWPGFDSAFAEEKRNRRREAGVSSTDIVLVYNGNIHASNAGEVRSLLAAVGLLHRRGYPVRLLKTGWNHFNVPYLDEAKNSGIVVDLGFLPREELPRLLQSADVLVQPGTSNLFNDYRFPSKLPEFLASGKPVILPRSNIGRFLKDGIECVLLEKGDAFDIAEKIEMLIADKKLSKRIGEAGRQFAMQELTWDKGISVLKEFYEDVLQIKAGKTVVSLQPETLNAAAAPPVKLITFYLPQFHPIPENDQWWGKGFTEWTNVTAAKSQFAGHFQPQLPSDLGFYDLRVPAVLEAQAELARSYGVFGFCFYYYWFNGKKLLETPLEQMLRLERPKFPFCLCWANENWTRKWDGSESSILIRQEYSNEAATRLIEDMAPALASKSYINVGGKPLLLVYRVNLLPEPARIVEIWRRRAEQLGLPGLHLAAVQSFGITDPRPYGFDSAVEFPPHTARFLIDPNTIAGVNDDFLGYFEDYVAVMRHQLTLPAVDYPLYRCAMPAWDNTARRGNHAHILVNSSPDAYRVWLKRLVEGALDAADSQSPLVFINAWNEWAEGAFLEPDRVRGHANLRATRDALCEGIASHYQERGWNLQPEKVLPLLPAETGAIDYKDIRINQIQSKNPIILIPDAPAQMIKLNGNRKTSHWFHDAALEEIHRRYLNYELIPGLSYATVADYCDSYDHLRSLATANGDLKDVQRPWALKALLSQTPDKGRVLEIGGGEPFVADLLERLGYEVWMVDPYDGSGNGPTEFERYRHECPHIRFIRARFDDGLAELPAQAFDAIYSISVLEHIPESGIYPVMAGLKKFLKPHGVSVHAIDYILRGNGAAEHYDNCLSLLRDHGIDPSSMKDCLKKLCADPETYYLSAESHNRWRGGLPYDKFPMRVCVSLQLVVKADCIKRFSTASGS